MIILRWYSIVMLGLSALINITNIVDIRKDDKVKKDNVLCLLLLLPIIIFLIWG